MCIRDRYQRRVRDTLHHRMPGKSAFATWNVVEAYPLFVAIGGGLSLCAAHLTRFTLKSPDVHVSKSHRANPMLENFDEGKRWKGLGVRGFAATSSYSAKANM
eukprot:TRINITY_DN3355_c0_g1_i2.p2 TRINITY_DN3355_c0_g1~~TRINITY_DN3355_c0_g1_i2.p2  ORF type:complete len:103 (+),score=17.63 TRINITY_DN3355_c0_g1_i2:77-385(+)